MRCIPGTHCLIYHVPDNQKQLPEKRNFHVIAPQNIGNGRMQKFSVVSCAKTKFVKICSRVNVTTHVIFFNFVGSVTFQFNQTKNKHN